MAVERERLVDPAPAHHEEAHLIDEADAARGAVQRVDGGAAANDLAMQFQSDVLQIPVQRPRLVETTAWGAACLAGLAVGYWQDQDELGACWRAEREFTPRMPAARCDALYGGWQEAVRRAGGWDVGATHASPLSEA